MSETMANHGLTVGQRVTVRRAYPRDERLLVGEVAHVYSADWAALTDTDVAVSWPSGSRTDERAADLVKVKS